MRILTSRRIGLALLAGLLLILTACVNPVPSNTGFCAAPNAPVTPLPGGPSSDVYDSPGTAADLRDLHNWERGTRGIRTLEWSNALANDARAFAAEIATKGTFGHSCNIRGSSPATTFVAENISHSHNGSTAAVVNTAYMSSPGHRAAILDGTYRRVGVGAVLTRTGKLITVVRFDNAAGSDAPPAGRVPTGALDRAQIVSGRLQVSGWAIDLDTAAPINVHVYYGPNPNPSPGQTGVAGFQINPAQVDRPDLPAHYPHHGTNHGFLSSTAPAVTANYACAYAIDQVRPSTNPQIGCRTVSR